MLEERGDTFLRLIRRAGRGRLKVYLGYGAGVGKTYQMLLEGQRLKDEGIDVVVGLVETHGRSETAKLIDGLEVVPRRRQEYRGVVLEEMELDAVLARKPQVALIDELAHTNVPGSRNPKRYQDVQDILAVGIHVITTLNIQHLESLYDMVEKATHVKIRERIPDTVLAEADQLVNVDLTTEDLRKRLLEGKVYPPERIQTALENFFRVTNLEKLRELTLRELAAQIDQRRRESPEETATTPDQIMVCLSSRGPNSEMLLRYASRLAGKLNRNWYAVYVQTPSEEPTVIDSHTQRILSGTLTLAKQLGAMVFTYKGEDIPDTVIRFAREYRVGTIVVGSPSSIPLWKRLLGKRGTVDRLVYDARGMNIVVLDTRGEKAAQPTLSRETEEVGPHPGRQAEGAVTPVTSQPALSELITPGRIVIWNHPVRKELALRTLVDAAVGGSGIGDPATILGIILKREEEGSTFFNEGVAFPHARI
ncbi:MAG: PTS sugar transporter subunit IIA, partial [Deltaproteobacteria bacterium]